MRFDGIFFDLYGTLLVYGEMKAAWDDWLSELARHLVRLGLAVPRKELADRCHGFMSRGEPDSGDQRLTVYERRLQTLFSELGFSVASEELGGIASSTAAAWQKHISVDPEAREILGELSVSVALALVTNFDHPPHVHGVLADSELVDYFDDVVVSAEVGIKKPDPAIFLGVLSRLDLEPERVAYVGDSPEDMEAARGAGFVPIRIRRATEGARQEAADYRQDSPRTERARFGTCHTISTLLELRGVLSSSPGR